MAQHQQWITIPADGIIMSGTSEDMTIPSVKCYFCGDSAPKDFAGGWTDIEEDHSNPGMFMGVCAAAKCRERLNKAVQ